MTLWRGIGYGLLFAIPLWLVIIGIVVLISAGR